MHLRVVISLLFFCHFTQADWLLHTNLCSRVILLYTVERYLYIFSISLEVET